MLGFIDGPMQGLEWRYQVIKLSDMTPKQARKLEKCLEKNGIRLREAIVCESHWPMFHQVKDLVLGVEPVAGYMTMQTPMQEPVGGASVLDSVNYAYHMKTGNTAAMLAIEEKHLLVGYPPELVSEGLNAIEIGKDPVAAITEYINEIGLPQPVPAYAPPYMPCRVPQPEGWLCSRAFGHDGPCAVIPPAAPPTPAPAPVPFKQCMYTGCLSERAPYSDYCYSHSPVPSAQPAPSPIPFEPVPSVKDEEELVAKEPEEVTYEAEAPQEPKGGAKKRRVCEYGACIQTARHGERYCEAHKDEA